MLIRTINDCPEHSVRHSCRGRGRDRLVFWSNRNLSKFFALVCWPDQAVILAPELGLRTSLDDPLCVNGLLPCGVFSGRGLGRMCGLSPSACFLFSLHSTPLGRGCFLGCTVHCYGSLDIVPQLLTILATIAALRRFDAGQRTALRR